MTRMPMPSLGGLPIGPDVGFESPFEMLTACHERAERMLALIERLDRHLAAHGADREAAEAARDVMRYFDLAGPAHHEDEERHVLPRLRALGAAPLADSLHEDHRRMAEAWRCMRRTLEAVCRAAAAPGAGSEAAPALAVDPRPPSATAEWAAFARHYRDHIATEEAVAYPAVAPRVGPEDRALMGGEMAARRGQRSPPA
jgi:hemerythrin-like domain-containing protein